MATPAPRTHNEVASMHHLLKQMDTSQKTTLAEIKQPTSAIEQKSSVILERLDNAEARLSFLEDATEAAKAGPLVPMSQMEHVEMG